MPETLMLVGFNPTKPVNITVNSNNTEVEIIPTTSAAVDVDAAGEAAEVKYVPDIIRPSVRLEQVS